MRGHGSVRVGDEIVVIGVALGGLHERTNAARPVAHGVRHGTHEAQQRDADVREGLVAGLDDAREAVRSSLGTRERFGKLREAQILVDIRVGAERSLDGPPRPGSIGEEVERHLGEGDGDARAVRPFELPRDRVARALEAHGGRFAVVRRERDELP